MYTEVMHSFHVKLHVLKLHILVMGNKLRASPSVKTGRINNCVSVSFFNSRSPLQVLIDLWRLVRHMWRPNRDLNTGVTVRNTAW